MKSKLKICMIISIILILVLVIPVVSNNYIKITNSLKIGFDKKIAEYEYRDSIICEAFYEGIKYFYYTIDNKWLVTYDNDVYIFSESEVFSNDTNCKKVEGFFNNISYTIRDIEGNLTYFDIDYNEISVSTKDYNGTIKKSKENIKNPFFKFPYLNSNYIAILYSTFFVNNYSQVQVNPGPLAIKGDNKIYGFGINYLKIDEETSSYETANENVEYQVSEDEIILDFYYTPNVKYYYNGKTEYPSKNLEDYKLKNFILTDKSYYRYVLKNEECKEYIDVECVYKLEKDTELSKIKDDILYRDEYLLITRQGRVYYSNYYGMGV